MAELKFLFAALLLLLVKSLNCNLVHEPEPKNWELLNAIYERKSIETKIKEGLFGLPENIDRPRPTSDDKDEVDCNIRYLAYNYSKKILSPSANFKAVADGLQLSSLCGISPKVPKSQDFLEHEKQILKIKSENDYFEYFVDARKDRFRGRKNGSKRFPFSRIDEATQACELRRHSTDVHCIIRLREGTHFVKDSIKLTEKHSNVLITK